MCRGRVGSGAPPCATARVSASQSLSEPRRPHFPDRETHQQRLARFVQTAFFVWVTWLIHIFFFYETGVVLFYNLVFSGPVFCGIAPGPFLIILNAAGPSFTPGTQQALSQRSGGSDGSDVSLAPSRYSHLARCGEEGA